MRSWACIAIAFLLSATAASAQPPDPPSSQTPRLRLVGVLRDAADPARSAALVQCNHPRESRAALVTVGHRACDAAELLQVLDNAVLVRNLLTNQVERLELPPPTSSSPPSPPLPAVDSPIEDREGVPAPTVDLTAPNVVTVELQRELLQRSLANLPEVLNSALAMPRYGSSEHGPRAIEGFEMSRIKPGGIIDQLGLREGDVLLEFNGQKLDSVSAVTSLFGQLQGLSGAVSGAKMAVLRNGSRLTFVFTVK